MTPERTSSSASRSQALDSVTASTAHELSDLGASLLAPTAEMEPQAGRDWFVGPGIRDGVRLMDPTQYPRHREVIDEELRKYPASMLHQLGTFEVALYNSSHLGDTVNLRNGGRRILLSITITDENTLLKTLHHEMLHALDAKLRDGFDWKFHARYHNDLKGWKNYSWQAGAGFADPLCQISLDEDMATTAEGLWDRTTYDRYVQLNDPVVIQKMQFIAKFYEENRVAAPYTANVLYVGRTEHPDGWYVFHWKTQALCQSRSGGQACQRQPDGTYVYYQRKADVDRAGRSRQ